MLLIFICLLGSVSMIWPLAQICLWELRLVYASACIFPFLASTLRHCCATFRCCQGTWGNMYTNLTFWQHITNLCKSCFYDMRAKSHIRLTLTRNLSEIIACLLVSFCTHFASSFLGVPQTLNSRVGLSTVIYLHV